MKLKYRLQHAFKNRILAPQLDRMDTWEGSVINRPGVFNGGEEYPVRFNIPREGLKIEGDRPPMLGFPGSMTRR